jgi:hypothetical protein
MLVQVFPLDRHLPNLSRLIAGPTPELEGALRESLGGADWRIRDVAVEPTRYRPFLGATLRYTVEAVDPAGRRHVQPFYVKLYRDDGGAEALATLVQLAEVSRQAGGRFEAVQPIGYFGELRALVLASVPGHSLEAVLIAETDVEPAVRKVARALAGLHRAPAPPGRHRRKQGMLDRAVRAGSFIRWARPAEARRIDRLLDKLQSRLSDDAFAPTHLDLKPDHIFLDGDRVVLIDLDSFALADPVSDPATLLARLEALPDLAPVSPQTARLAADTLVEEYFRAVPAGWRERLGANYACAALKVALYYLQHQEPAWPAKVAALLERAERRL